LVDGRKKDNRMDVCSSFEIMEVNRDSVLKTIGSEERLLIQNLEITQGCEQCLEREFQLSSNLALYSLPCTTTLTNHMG
jgi:hypothetical protein